MPGRSLDLAVCDRLRSGGLADVLALTGLVNLALAWHGALRPATA
jgi:hypothetical protein